MDLNPATDDTPGPLTAAAARDPKPFGFALLAVGVVGLFAAIYFGYAAYTSGRPPADAPEGGEALGGLVNRGFVVAALAGFGVALVGLGVGIATMARVPADDPRRRRTEARTLILTGGGLLGLVVMAAGAFYVVYTFGVLTDWLTDKTPPKQAWQPVAALLTVLVGAGLAFLAAQPARAEERNNPFLRRLVYGGNLALASLLLLLALVVGNVLVGLKVPNKLDTTEAGFYSLSDATKGYVADLQQPVTFAAVIPDGEDRSLSDIRRLLAAFQEVNPGKVKVQYYSPNFSKDIATLRAKYPLVGLNDLGVIVATGPDDANYSFVRADDFFQAGASGGVSFQAEGKLIKEMVFLSESKTKPVVYALTGHGELEVAPDPAGGADAVGGRRQATKVRAALEKANVEVKPLAFPLKDPKVPDDAAVVLVLDPTGPLAPAEAAALTEYMAKPRGDKKGKLIVATGPRPKPDRTGVAPTGLEDVLAPFGVKLGTEYLLTQPARGLGYQDVLVAPSARLEEGGNPIAAEFSTRSLVLPTCRRLELVPAPPGGPGPAAELLFGSQPGPITWLEADPPANPGKLFEELLNDPEQQVRKKATQRRPWPVAAIASEGGAGRLAVFGSGEAFADPDRRAARPSDAAADLVAVTVNWLRDRPAVANIAAKDYRTYTLDRKASDTALLWLPVGAVLFGILALGIGVWVFRRK